MLPGAGADIAAWISLAASQRLAATTTEDDFGRRTVAQRHRRRHRGQQRGPGRQLDPGAGVRHSRRLGHRHRHRRAADEERHAGPQGVSPNRRRWSTASTFIFLLANLVLLPVGFAAIKLGGIIVRVPRRVLLP